MAAPAFRARTMLTAATGSSRVATVPATTAATDALFIAHKVEFKGTVTPPAGWSEVALQKTAAIEEWSVAVFCLPNWNGVTTEYTVSWTGSKGNKGVIWSVSGADLTTPVSATHNASITENTPATTKATIGAYSVPTNESRPFTVVFNNQGLSVTPGTGYTEFGDQADGPEACYRTEAVNAGELAKVEHTISSAVTLVSGFSVQPPQAAAARASSLLLGVG